MTEGLKIFRLVPTAASDDPNWQNSPSHGEVIVRALTAGDARIVMESEAWSAGASGSTRSCRCSAEID